MKKITSTLLILTFGILMNAQDKHLVFKGVYSGQNVYVKNPKSGDDSFCVVDVMVNGVSTFDQYNSTAFSIDLENSGFEIADSLTILIKHQDGCEPNLINPEVISPASTFEIEDILLTKDGRLQWTTKNEGGQLPFIVEQYKWNKWVPIGVVHGQGGKETNKYSFEFQMHYGKNTLRIKQKDRSVEHASRQVSAESLKEEPVSLVNANIKKMLTFSEETAFEIYNEYGELVLSEIAQSIDLTELPKGPYYLNFGASYGVEIFKK